MKNNPLHIPLSILFIISIFTSCKKDETNIDPPSDFQDYEFLEPDFNGSVFYIDPVNGSPDGDGSSGNPWRTLQEVAENNLIECYQPSENYNPDSELKLVNENAPVKGGDKLVLRNGYHGYLHRNTFVFKDWLIIEAAPGHHPVLSQINITGAFENIYFKNITILKDSYQGTGMYWETETLNRNNGSCFVLSSNDFWGKGSNVKINGLTIKTTEDISGWSANDWVEKSASGISLRSVENIEILNCTIENIRHGILFEYFSDHSIAVHNTINNYCADGCRLISNDVFFAYNTISNCFKVDDNHDDAIQSYSRGSDNSPGTGILYNNVIRGNTIIGNTNSSHPLAGYPQGIGCFDGFYDNWVIENNVVITNHYHGISFYGMRNGKIVNNTVIDQDPSDDISPWIRITDHKNGTPSQNCMIANNIVFRSIGFEGNNVDTLRNYVIGSDNYAGIYELFNDPDAYDLHLRINENTRANIIDKGEIFDLISTEIDLDNRTRSLPPDLGAYESDN